MRHGEDLDDKDIKELDEFLDLERDDYEEELREISTQVSKRGMVRGVKLA